VSFIDMSAKVIKSLDPQRYLFFYYEKGGVFYAPLFQITEYELFLQNIVLIEKKVRPFL